MSLEHASARRYAEALLSEQAQEHWRSRLEPRRDHPAPRVRNSPRVDDDAIRGRWDLLPGREAALEELLDARTREQGPRYARNIENFIGTVKVPVGLAGPLRVNGLFAGGDYYVPLATTEAALVASYSRGAQVISAAGGCTAMLLSESVGRAPGFAFRDLREGAEFLLWATGQFDEFRRIAESTTRFGRLRDLRFTVEGNHVYLGFEYWTGDASGQNMATIATQAVLDDILARSPVKPRHAFVESNLSGDKKATANSFLHVRGKKVSAEVTLPADLTRRLLHATPGAMVDYWRMSALGGVLSGAIGVQGHYANALAALYMACGQDVACVAESAVGVTRMEQAEVGDLYACVTLPNLMVATVGGGTGLPSQRSCLEILNLSGPDHARALAEVAAALCLAGELSITAALTSGEFTRAHRSLARAK